MYTVPLEQDLDDRHTRLNALMACTRSGRRSPPSKGSEGSRGETTPRTRADTPAGP
jgi:hypothetical protein